MAGNLWFNAFKRTMNPVFTENDFAKCKRMVKKSLGVYKKYLKSGSRILDVGCGLGCTSVPLSAFGFAVTGIDSDSKVVAAARENAKNFGKEIKIKKADAFEIVKIFGKNSFDACISDGFLEHFKSSDIRKLVRDQLKVAPVVIASMPVRTKLTLAAYGLREDGPEENVDWLDIQRHFWPEEKWVSDIFRNFNIAEHFVGKSDPFIGSFEEITVVIKRNES